MAKQRFDDDDILDWWSWIEDEGMTIKGVARRADAAPHTVRARLQREGIYDDLKERGFLHTRAARGPYTRRKPEDLGAPAELDVGLVDRALAGRLLGDDIFLFDAISRLHSVWTGIDYERQDVDGSIGAWMPYIGRSKSHHYIPQSARQRRMDALGKPGGISVSVRNELAAAGLFGSRGGRQRYRYWH